MESESHLHPVVVADRRLYATSFGTRAPETVGDLLDALVDTVSDAVPAGDPAAIAYFRNWHPDFLGATPTSISESPPDRLEARLAVARGHGFFDWSASQAARDRQFDPQFEAAADAVVSGDERSLVDLLSPVDPRSSRIDRRSGTQPRSFTMWLPTGSEFRRQECGPEAPVVTERLLSSGAAVDALANTYGGGTSQTALVLLLTSGHPAVAGVTNAVLDVLLRHGADPNGVNADGSPLRAARGVGNDGAVARLTAAGAQGA